ncbi:MAG: RDD family protein [Proteobacteria bacterium]|nr:RDD family protein [Pseudomonadota bacterium]
MSAADLKPAGAGRRIAALAIDLVLLTLLLELLAIPAFSISGGRVQAMIGLYLNTCRPLEYLKEWDEALPPLPAGTPDDAVKRTAHDCVTRVIGSPTSRYLRVDRSIEDPSSSAPSLFVVQPLDADGIAIDAFNLEWLFLPLLFVYRTAAEFFFRRGIGQRLMGLRVVEAATIARAALGKLALRNAILAIALAAFWATPYAIARAPIVSALVGIAGLVALLMLMRGRLIDGSGTLPHDRTTGTMVVRIGALRS